MSVSWWNSELKSANVFSLVSLKSLKRFFFFGKFKIPQTFFLVSLNEGEKYTASWKSDMMSGDGGEGVGGGAWQVACKLMNLIKVYSNSTKVLF